jgi:adenylate cyclase
VGGCGLLDALADLRCAGESLQCTFLAILGRRVPLRAESNAPSQTFLFADLASYTVVTEVHGDEEAARIVEKYCADLRQLLSEHNAREVKTIGDAMLVRVPDAGQAVLLGTRAALELGGAAHGSPSVRVGMHYGAAIEKSGDYFGRAVNIAARVSAIAAAGEVLVTDDVVRAAGKVESVRFMERGRHVLKGIEEPVMIYLAVSVGEHSPEGLPIDPVCQMAVDPDRAAASVLHEGSRYHLCSLRCLRLFAAHPEHYV